MSFVVVVVVVVVGGGGGRVVYSLRDQLTVVLYYVKLK